MSVYRVSSNKSSVNNFPTVRPTLDLDFANSKTLDPRITFTRSSGGSYVGADGLIKLAGVNEARFDHDPVTGESLGLLVEEARTNNTIYSEDVFSWSIHSSALVTVNQTFSPDGTLTADEVECMEEGNFSGRVNTQENLLSTNFTGCFSVFIKYINNPWVSISVNMENNIVRRCWWNIQEGIVGGNTQASSGGGTLISQTIQDYGNGWYRCSAVVTPPTGNRIKNAFIQPAVANTNVTAILGSKHYIWGAQLEEGAFPTSYIPTIGSTRTRAKELVYIPNVDRTDWYNKAEGTISFEHTTIPVSVSAPTGFPAFGFANTINGASDQAIQYFITSRFANAAFLVRDLVAQGGSFPLDQVTISIPSPANIGAKVSFAYKFNDFGVARNGIFIGRDNTGIVPNNAYMLIIGQNNIDLNQQINAHCKYLKYYPKRLPNAQLQALTK